MYQKDDPKHSDVIMNHVWKSMTKEEQIDVGFLILLGAREIGHSHLEDRCVRIGSTQKEFGRNGQYELNYVTVHKRFGKGVMRQNSIGLVPCTCKESMN